METRQENRPVSTSGASALLKLAMRLLGVRSAEPCARDPPSACHGVSNAASRAFGGRATATRLGEDLPNTRPQTERGDATTSPLPNAGLAKLVPVTASYVTPEIYSLPTPRSRLSGRSGSSGQAGSRYPRVSGDPACIIHGEPVRRHACHSHLVTHNTSRPSSLSSSPSPPGSASLTGA